MDRLRQIFGITAAKSEAAASHLKAGSGNFVKQDGTTLKMNWVQVPRSARFLSWFSDAPKQPFVSIYTSQVAELLSNEFGIPAETIKLSKNFKDRTAKLGDISDKEKFKILQEVEIDPKNLKANLALAKAYEKGIDVEKDMLKAMLHYRAVLEINPSDKTALDGIFNTATEVLKKNPDNVDANLTLAKCYKDKKDMSHARAYYSAVLRSDPTHIQANLGILEVDPKNAQAHLTLAKGYQDGIGVVQNLRTAREHYLAVLEINPSDKTALDGIFKVEIQIHVANPKDVEINLTLAKRYQDGIGVAKNTEKAMSHYRAVLEIDPKNMKANRGILEIDPKNEEANLNLAKCYQEGIGVEKDISQAIFHYRKVLESNPNNTQAHKGILEATKKILEATPDNVDANLTLAKYFQEGIEVEKDLHMAIRLYRIVLDSDPKNEKAHKGIFNAANEILRTNSNDVDANLALAKCYQEGIGISKDMSKAVVIYIKVLKKDPTNLEANLNLAKIYQEGGIGVKEDISKAITYYQAVLKLDPKNLEANLALAKCYEEGSGVKKNINKAAVYYCAVLDANPTDKVIIEKAKSVITPVVNSIDEIMRSEKFEVSKKGMEKLLKNLGLEFNDLEQLQAYGQGTRIEYIVACLKSVYNPKNEKSSSVLGKGGFNTVYKIQYKNGETRVFKADELAFGEPEARPMVIRTSGIDTENPRMAQRSLATYRLAQRLGFDVIVKTDPAFRGDKAGIVMKLAKGHAQVQHKKLLDLTDAEKKAVKQLIKREKIEFDKSTGLPKKDNDRNLLEQLLGGNSIIKVKGVLKKEVTAVLKANQRTSPVYQRETVKLQLLDAITGQVDRHAGNYFVQTNASGNIIGIKGIDNDLCFGKDYTDPQIRGDGYNTVRLPLVVDTEMYDTIMGLSEEDLRKELDTFPTDAEFAAAKSRLEKVKVHLENLKKQGRIINSSKWGTEAIIDLLNETQKGKKTSYYARDMASILAPERYLRVVLLNPAEEVIT